MFSIQSDNCTPFVHIFDIIFSFAAEMEEPKIDIRGQGLTTSFSKKFLLTNKSASDAVSLRTSVPAGTFSSMVVDTAALRLAKIGGLKFLSINTCKVAISVKLGIPPSDTSKLTYKQIIKPYLAYDVFHCMVLFE